jgi:putative tryptophan/tyrosine transport system substrate-binding protein
MRRRTFISLLGAAAAWPLAARAQQQAVPVIGFLHSASADPRSSYWPATEAFRQGLGEAGFSEGKNLVIEYRWAEDQFDRLPALAGDLVKRNVSLIFAGGGDVVALAAKSATSTIPIVFAIGADPVRQGIVTSLGRPGGNVTGATFLSVELRPKTVELVRELVPDTKTIAVLANPNRPGFEQLVAEVLEPARNRGLQAHVLKASNEQEIEAAFSTFPHARADALLVLSDPVYLNRRDQIAQLAKTYRLPTIHAARELVVAGGLASYGASIKDAYRQGGDYCGRILKGERPADLPVLQPTKFELVINLKTAKALGLEVPPTLLARADEVIE